MNASLLALARAINDHINRTDPAQLARSRKEFAAFQATLPSKQQRLEQLVKEINAARDRDRAAALAVQIRDTIQEPEPAPAPKTPEQLAAQRIQDERDYYEFIANRQKEVTA